MKINTSIFVSLLFAALSLSTSVVVGQEDPGFEKQLWIASFFNFRLNDNWIYHQDAAYAHSYETPTFTRFFLRSQVSRQITGAFSAHGGLNLFYIFNEVDNNALELRPWVGGKLRWPSFWRVNIVNYLRFEQRFQHTMNVSDWENNFRVRFKVGSNIPINNPSITNKTLYGVLAYEFFSVSFGDDIRFTTAATHRFDVGFGYRQNVKNSYEALVLALNGLSEDNGHYNLSSGVLFLRYKRFINWE